MKLRYLIIILMVMIGVSFANENNQQNYQDRDMEITKIIQDKIKNNPVVSNFKIDVYTKGGIVNLHGLINSNMEAETIVDVAYSIPDVNDVITTQLYIEESNQPFTDILITTKIRAILIKEKFLGKDENIPIFNINIETNNGIVYLSGSEIDKKQIEYLIKIIKSIRNVKDVKYKIRLDQ